MTDGRFGSVAVACSLLLVPVAPAGVADLPGEVHPPRIPETQLTVRVGPVQGQATVVHVAGETLTVLTAAHFLSADDVGKGFLVRHRDRTLKGRVVAVTRNPGFRPLRSRGSRGPSASGTVGVDTEVAAFKIEPEGLHERRALETIRAADLTDRLTPDGPGRILEVHIVDQFGEEHVVRAGNHLNPVCLAWGRGGYDTRRGDSGSGVFLMRKTARGVPWPVLIGNVSQTDGRGGFASLAHRDAPWIAKALSDAGPVGRPAASSP